MDHDRTTAGRFLRSLPVNALINTAIAVMLTGIGFSGGFVAILINSQCIGFSIYFSALLVIPLYKRATGPITRIAIIVSAVIVGSIIGAMLGAFANGMSPLLYIRKYSMYFSQAVLVGLFFGSIISYVFISLGTISQEKMKRLDIEKSAAETELKLLQSQMEPHFLFNTLSNVMGLIERDPEKAKRMLESFTSFLRASFLTARDRTVTLSHEAEVVKNYLDVFAVRMGDRLHYRIDISVDLREFRIPPLLIQPLVENAAKHGLESSVQGGEISVRAVRDNGVVRITVADSGKGISEKSGGSGIGLENIRKRLQLLYAGQGRLILEENSPVGVKAIIEVPYETYTSHHSR
jgi:sensor histidine kinase YesM